MLVLPAIDIKSGRCVRLYQGKADRETVYSEDPAAMALRWEGEGAEFLHLVDLDGAFAGEPKNWETVKKIIAAVSVPVELGGGVRSPETIEMLLAGGVSRVIVGSRAAADPGFLSDIFREFQGRILPSIDVREGMVMIRGWEEETELRAEDLGRDLKKIGFKLVIHTDTSADGTLQGPNLAALEDFLDRTGLGVIAAGGVSRIEDIRDLKKLERKGLVGAITGQAIYAGTLDLRAAIREAK
ncbi:MAG: 1-(5-phosphoribosyl)-5-[(5-phosphoribosylamino)methylideneamino]imidazole-4-carboxamide isomerase [Candidatus Erginobacter occultus]|nr:1-(5-phosphoribosyl)-5-[(5-phosphoribosylamino)methylideneamino]imidazole-4-carboxamide isomerase [Candidatus Erginobacter occultus]